MWARRASDTQETVFLDVTKLTVLPKKVLDVPYEGPFESRRLWSKVTEAIRRPEGPDWKTVEEGKTQLGRRGGVVGWKRMTSERCRASRRRTRRSTSRGRRSCS